MWTSCLQYLSLPSSLSALCWISLRQFGFQDQQVHWVHNNQNNFGVCPPNHLKLPLHSRALHTAPFASLQTALPICYYQYYCHWKFTLLCSLQADQYTFFPPTRAPCCLSSAFNAPFDFSSMSEAGKAGKKAQEPTWWKQLVHCSEFLMCSQGSPELCPWQADGAGSSCTCAAVIAQSLLRWLSTLTAINSTGLILPSVLKNRWMCLLWKVLDFKAGCCDLGWAVWLMQLARLWSWHKASLRNGCQANMIKNK